MAKNVELTKPTSNNHGDISKADKAKLTFDSLKDYVEVAFKKYLSATEAGTEEERVKEQQRKEVLRQCCASCYAGTTKERQLVKQFITRILTGQVPLFLEGYGETGINITPDNFKYIFPWDNPYRLPTHVKFLGILYFWREEFGAGAFEHVVSRYGLSKLRSLTVMQGDDKLSKGMYIDARDIDAVFEGDGIIFTYELAMDVLVQMLYEEFKGNGCIDELLYQDVDDVGIGLSGLQSDVEPTHLKGRKVKKAYEGAWIKYKGLLMNINFLSFHDFANLRRVVTQLVAYDMQGSFSEKDGYKMGYGKDGSRRTSVITPFAENPAAWVRKFTAKKLTNKQLINNADTLNIDGIDDLIAVEKALVRGGATIPICGPQGVGKTTKLEGITEYIQNWFAIRMIESEFEARIRWRYPEKNILTVQTPTITAEKAYEFSLRTSGDIYIVSEVRSDEMMVNITRTANRGGRSVIFTYHPNKPRATIIEIANSLIRQKLYTTLKDAMYTTLETIKCCIHIDLDISNHSRYYNVYEYVPVESKINTEFLKLSGREREEAFMRTQADFYRESLGNEYFEVIPIITYESGINGAAGKYSFQNNISDRLFNDLYLASNSLEKDELERLFRPQQYMKNKLESQLPYPFDMMDAEEIIELMDKEHINKAFVNIEELQSTEESSRNEVN